jgi:hypothetical protein
MIFYNFHQLIIKKKTHTQKTQKKKHTKKNTNEKRNICTISYIFKSI